MAGDGNIASLAGKRGGRYVTKGQRESIFPIAFPDHRTQMKARNCEPAESIVTLRSAADLRWNGRGLTLLLLLVEFPLLPGLEQRRRRVRPDPDVQSQNARQKKQFFERLHCPPPDCAGAAAPE